MTTVIDIQEAYSLPSQVINIRVDHDGGDEDPSNDSANTCTINSFAMPDGTFMCCRTWDKIINGSCTHETRNVSYVPV